MLRWRKYKLQTNPKKQLKLLLSFKNIETHLLKISNVLVCYYFTSLKLLLKKQLNQQNTARSVTAVLYIPP